MGNNPVKYADPDGGCVGDDCAPIAQVGDCQCSYVNGLGDRITEVQSFTQAVDMGLDVFQGGIMQALEFSAGMTDGEIGGNIVRMGREKTAPYFYPIVLAPAFYAEPVTAYLGSVMNNYLSDYSSQKMFNPYDIKLNNYANLTGPASAFVSPFIGRNEKTGKFQLEYSWNKVTQSAVGGAVSLMPFSKGLKGGWKLGIDYVHGVLGNTFQKAVENAGK